MIVMKWACAGWLFKHAGTLYGPVSRDQLRELVAAGWLQQAGRVWEHWRQGRESLLVSTSVREACQFATGERADPGQPPGKVVAPVQLAEAVAQVPEQHPPGTPPSGAGERLHTFRLCIPCGSPDMNEEIRIKLHELRVRFIREAEEYLNHHRDDPPTTVHLKSVPRDRPLVGVEEANVAEEQS